MSYEHMRAPEKTVGDREPEPDKRMLRRELLAVRSRLTADDVREAAAALAAGALELPELAHARTVAAYVSVGSEPGTRALLDALRARGVRVLLPVLLPDNDLDWGVYDGEGSLARVQHGGRMALRNAASGSADAVTRPTPYAAAGPRAVDAAGCGRERRLVRPCAGRLERRGRRSGPGGAAVRLGGRRARPGGAARPAGARGGDAVGVRRFRRLP